MKTLRFSALLRITSTVLIALIFLPWPSAANAAGQTWQGEYFGTMDLTGNPVFTRADADVNFNWGWGSPDSRIPVDHFSVRWTRIVNLPAGQWRFSVSVDDGVRLFVDGNTVIDQWHITAPITYTSSVSLPAGDHTLRVEYYENTERALIHVWWAPDSSTATATSAPAAVVPVTHAGVWQAEYYNNRNLSGDPTFKRNDAAVYFDWGENGPGGGLSGHDFSVRWTRSVFIPNGDYKFKAKADDGVRVWLDWVAVIDQWHTGPMLSYSKEVHVSTGNHTIVVEYFQGGGVAAVQAGWEDKSVNWVGNLTTCMRGDRSWVKVYRLTPNDQWEDLKPDGYGPIDASGSLKLFGVPVDASYSWDGQPYMVELWIDGKMVRSEGNFFAGQPVMRITPGADVRTTWPCGANLPQ